MLLLVGYGAIIRRIRITYAIATINWQSSVKKEQIMKPMNGSFLHHDMHPEDTLYKHLRFCFKIRRNKFVVL